MTLIRAITLLQAFPRDSVHVGATNFSILVANSREEVENNFNMSGLHNDIDHPVVFLQGWFKDTLPSAALGGVFRSGFVIIRLDGDLYESTWQALTVLYPLLHSGGYVIVDDFFDWEGCHNAVLDFRKQNRISSPLIPVYHDFSRGEEKRGVWWQKA